MSPRASLQPLPTELAPAAGTPAVEASQVVGRPARLAVAAGVCVSVLLLVALAAKLAMPSTGPRPGAPAPTFAFTTFDGQSVDLAALGGRAVVLNFWASWCVTCVYEAPDLERVWRDYRDRGVTVVGVAYNDTRPAAQAYLEQHGVTYPNGMDPGGTISSAYRVTGVPETVVIDARGNIVPLRLQATSGAHGGAAGNALGETVGKIVGPITATSAFTPDSLRRTLDSLVAGGEP
jgi:cytochrome c biogenesis protein CcmG/thiol:disulfide interchange protein DsbE